MASSSNLFYMLEMRHGLPSCFSALLLEPRGEPFALRLDMPGTPSNRKMKALLIALTLSLTSCGITPEHVDAAADIGRILIYATK